MPQGDGYWTERARRLSALGLTDLNDWMTDPPVQVSGRALPGDHAFYLRLRDGSASLEVYVSTEKNISLVWNTPLLWQGDTEYEQGPDTLTFAPELVEAVAADLLRQWRSGSRPRPTRPPSA